ncbi:uncharacterized protein LOC134248482, partial [Saccostrea cucullata]|uniref:uncharacterized protein LOC134248482 n=1 Tax=Saccostrea cuccullata TaxID=36930 RepID=UPI002ED113FB
MCNLTREEREFLEKAHLDVDEDDADGQSNDKEDNEIESNNTDSESNHANQNIISTQLPITSTSDDEASVTTGDLDKLPLDLSPLPRESTIPLQDVTNSQVIRNAQQMQSGVSPYYKNLYNRLFQNPAVSNKRRYSDSMCSMKENSDHWNNDLYPLELFPKKPATVATLQKFDPAVDDIVDFKPNSALSAGTNVFLSGYWRKGRVTKVDMDDSKGKVYTVEDFGEDLKEGLKRKKLVRVLLHEGRADGLIPPDLELEGLKDMIKNLRKKTGAWLRGKRMEVNYPDHHPECMAAPFSEYEMGKDIGTHLTSQDVLVWYVTTDVDAQRCQ